MVHYGTSLTSTTALVSGEKSNFQFILRLLNTNVDGRQKIMYALTKIKGVGRRYSNLVCKKADVDLNKRYASTEPPCHFGPRKSLTSIANGRPPILEPVKSLPKNSNASSPSSRIQPNTKSPAGSSIANVTLWMARTLKCWQTAWTASCVRTWSA